MGLCFSVWFFGFGVFALLFFLVSFCVFALVGVWGFLLCGFSFVFFSCWSSPELSPASCILPIELLVRIGLLTVLVLNYFGSI